MCWISEAILDNMEFQRAMGVSRPALLDFQCAADWIDVHQVMLSYLRRSSETQHVPFREPMWLFRMPMVIGAAFDERYRA